MGDGINDAAALALSHLGIAMGTGTDVAMQAADLTLVRGDVEAVPEALHLARRMNRIVRGKPILGFYLQCGHDSTGNAGFPQPDDGWSCHGVLGSFRCGQFPPVAVGVALFFPAWLVNCRKEDCVKEPLQ